MTKKKKKKKKNFFGPKRVHQIQTDPSFCLFNSLVLVEHTFLAMDSPGNRSKYIPGMKGFNTIKKFLGVSIVTQWVRNLTSIHEDVSLIPGFTHRVKDLALL